MKAISAFSVFLLATIFMAYGAGPPDIVPHAWAIPVGLGLAVLSGMIIVSNK